MAVGMAVGTETTAERLSMQARLEQLQACLADCHDEIRQLLGEPVSDAQGDAPRAGAGELLRDIETSARELLNRLGHIREQIGQL